MEMRCVANLATLQTPLATFFPLKKAPKPLVSENRRYCHAILQKCEQVCVSELLSAKKVKFFMCLIDMNMFFEKHLLPLKHV